MTANPAFKFLQTIIRRPSIQCQCRNAWRPCPYPPTPSLSIPRSRGISTREGVKKLLKENPVAAPLGFLAVATGAGSLLYTTYLYTAYTVPINEKFPEPVANKLRRALYYTNVEPQPGKANQYYKQAVELCKQHGMHPYSDEVMGIRLTFVDMLEKTGDHDNAINALELMRADCLNWVERVAGDAAFVGHRTRVLAKTVGMSIKLGELYACEYIKEPELAEKNLIQGIEMAFREQQRRDEEGVKEGEGPWLSSSELGASTEALANHYQEHSQHGLSAPLYLRAITFSPPTCHLAVLMNNLSTSLAQTLPQSAPSPSGVSPGPPTSRAALISNARSWAEKAIEVATKVTPPERTEECEIGCAVATHNLGEFAEMEGLVEEARKRYTEAGSLAKAVGFREGVKNARMGLERLEKR